jgi:hypothetical protein
MISFLVRKEIETATVSPQAGEPVFIPAELICRATIQCINPDQYEKISRQQ